MMEAQSNEVEHAMLGIMRLASEKDIQVIYFGEDACSGECDPHWKAFLGKHDSYPYGFGKTRDEALIDLANQCLAGQTKEDETTEEFEKKGALSQELRSDMLAVQARAQSTADAEGSPLAQDIATLATAVLRLDVVASKDENMEGFEE